MLDKKKKKWNNDVISIPEYGWIVIKHDHNHNSLIGKIITYTLKADIIVSCYVLLTPFLALFTIFLTLGFRECLFYGTHHMLENLIQQFLHHTNSSIFIKQTCRQTLGKYEDIWLKGYKLHQKYDLCRTDTPLDSLEAIWNK